MTTTTLVVLVVFVAFVLGLAITVARLQVDLVEHFNRKDAVERARYIRAHVGSGYTEDEARAAEDAAGLRKGGYRA